MSIVDTPNLLACARGLFFVLLAACSADSALLEADSGSATSDYTVGDQPPPVKGSTQTDGLDTEPPSFWSVGGVLDVSKGTVQIDTSVVEIGLWTDGAELVCTLEVPLVAATPSDPKSELALLQWNVIDHDAGAPAKSSYDCPGWPAGSLEVGIGLYDTALDPAMDASGMLGADVYGLYVRPTTEDPIYLIGIASTAEIEAGTDTTVADGPLPDGSYDVETLVLLSVP